MYISFSAGFFLFALLSGTILSISSDSWFGAWCGLELNLMAFIPFVSMSSNQYSSEASLKYFLIQALGSAFIILGAIMYSYMIHFLSIMSIALLLKLGAAPFHFWFPQVMEGMDWSQCIILMTVQKMAPMYLLSYIVLSSNSIIMFYSAIISAVVGGVGGVNQTFLRKLLAFSSINHMSWMLFAMFMSETSWLLYFLFYSLISISVVFLFYSHQAYYLSQLMSVNQPILSMLGFLSLLSLGGLPPFTGFIPKWIIIQEMVFQKLFFILLLLLLMTLLTLYYYLRLTIVFMNILSFKTKSNLKDFILVNKIPLFMVINFLGLTFPSLFMLI
uniref:NADH-ubiquinone oxidoreductase chain 2 n=1 Tax=Eiconaxius sp. 1 QK-2020 TaxID=2699496 RepID=A0A6M5U4Z0_9EUCA|nr:NADH dehydrogenase subunit 2 [Eiconaxius sp. 1 QK-2020]